MKVKQKYFDRELSWLSFNYRVLQEAKDKTVPLYERIKFLAIYSSNLDEFFKVRVATLRSLLVLKQKSKEQLKFDPKELLKNILATVKQHQREFGEIFRNEIIPGLKENKINLIDNSQLNKNQSEYLDKFFEENIRQHIQPFLLIKNKITPFLKNKYLYFVVRLSNKNDSSALPKRIVYKYAIIEIPSNYLPRFIEIPNDGNEKFIIFLDDIIRYKLESIFEAYNVIDCYSIKLTRDAELYIEDEFSGDLVSKILAGIKKRNTGLPSRFLYDENMPKEILSYLKSSFRLNKEDLSEGGKYHNFSDFFSFPNPIEIELEYPKQVPLRNKELVKNKNIFEAISEKDYLLHFPYQSFDHVLEFVNSAAEDPDVTTIKMTQYRVAKDSRVLHALINAAQKAKNVIVFVEVKARFDEHANISWGEEMKKMGIDVYYSLPGFKVHSKLLMVTRNEEEQLRNYCFFGTGNFNENTAKIYSDIGLLTANKNLTDEVEKVFDFLIRGNSNVKFEHLLVAKFNMRKRFMELIDNEITIAKTGGKAKIILKMNSLEDKKMINKLYEASESGVKIYIILRGICCLIPGVKGMSKNIKVYSIIDKYLEHARIFLFNNAGSPITYCGSADWMRRNLSKRIEVVFPIYDEKMKKEIIEILEIQMKDNVKARIIDKKQINKYKKNNDNEIVRSQFATYDYFLDKE
ncbi:MAG: polyphosphate kinase 1 [Ignavibacteriales bacterium]|nr:polyphosphate kinase 1 [Ignavibacteriales bacterium]MCB9220015.1 polyphosphate kinase 1 [Ignavibacteriales bacterium]